jgi:hypothetical protein
MCKSFKVISLIIILFTLVGCKSSHHGTDDKLNPELLGKWSDDNGCSLELTLHQQQLQLINFANDRGYQLNNVSLVWHKESIMTKLVAINSALKWSAIFSEGFLMIDDHLCKQPLHKVDSK